MLVDSLICCLTAAGLGRGGDFKDDSLDVYQFFNTSCYSGFDDSEKVKDEPTSAFAANIRTVVEVLDVCIKVS